MTRFLLAGAAALAALVAAPSAQAAICDLKNVSTCRAFAGETACGETGEKCGIQRCYHWTDYPTCLY